MTHLDVVCVLRSGLREGGIAKLIQVRRLA